MSEPKSIYETGAQYRERLAREAGDITTTAAEATDASGGDAADQPKKARKPRKAKE